MNIWFDIDNPPQARYLLPLVRRFAHAGHSVILTARATPETTAILASEGMAFHPIGGRSGKSKLQKAYGVVARSRLLTRELNERRFSAAAVISASRAAAVAARRLRIPSFAIIDYEYVNLTVFRLAGSYVLHPDVIPRAVLERRGLRRERLIGFPGLKEHITFADVDLAEIEPYGLGESPGPVRVLFRPPAEESHYHRDASRNFTRELVRRLAEQDVQVVFSPRYAWQIGHLDDAPSWRHEPVVLRKPAPSASLLKAVDAVISGGGTMAREAAFLGIPAYSVFRGPIGAVDRYLASINRLTIVSSPTELGALELRAARPALPLPNSADTASDVMRMITARLPLDA